MSGTTVNLPQANIPAPGQTAQQPSSYSSSNKDIAATINIELKQEQKEAIVSTVRNWQATLYSQYSLRNELENIDRIYMREADWTEDQIKSRLANRRGDSRKLQNITVPIVMPQVNSAMNYLMNVFATGYPIFPVVADPANEDAAMQLETIIQENAQTCGYAQQMALFFRDGLKYNIHALECDWRQRVTYTVENSPSSASNTAAKKVVWEGNVIRRMDLYNSFWDPRVHPSEIHTEGEFVGYTELYSRIRFKKLCNSLYNQASVKDITEAMASEPIQGAIGSSTNAPFGYYIPILNPFPFFNKTSTMDWMAWMTNTPTMKNGVNYKNTYSVTTVYARIIPSDYNIRVPSPNTPQVWKFLIINGKVVLLAERLTNVHNFIPVFFGQPIEDGLDYQTKSFASNVADMQDIASALWNGAIASKRRLVGDRVLYDPSRIRETDINSTNPAAKIPVRPSAQGKPLNEAVYQFPFKDDQVNSLVEASTVVTNMANLINGQNPAQQGQFVKGNKTRHEYDDIMGHGNATNQQIAISTEAQVFTPLKEVMKLNILQYQSPKSLYNTGKGKTVNIDPTDLRKSAVHFKVCDGLIPSDKVTGDDLLQTVIQQLASSPQLASQYNLGDAFTYLMKTQGLDLTPFAKSQEQIVFEQQMQAWQQAAELAAKQGVPFNTPQPQPSPQLQQQMQQKQQGQLPASGTSQALESTQS